MLLLLRLGSVKYQHVPGATLSSRELSRQYGPVRYKAMYCSMGYAWYKTDSRASKNQGVRSLHPAQRGGFELLSIPLTALSPEGLAIDLSLVIEAIQSAESVDGRLQ
jgi:hypothetical protein